MIGLLAVEAAHFLHVAPLRLRRHVFGEQREDLPLGLRLGERGHRAVAERQVGHQRHEVLEADLLVPARGRQHDVGVARGLAHAETDVDHELRAGEEMVADALSHSCVTQHVAADRDHHLRRRRALRRSDREVPGGERLVEIRARRPRQRRIAVRRIELHVAGAAVHRVEEAARDVRLLEVPLHARGIDERARAEPHEVRDAESLVHADEAETLECDVPGRLPAPAGATEVPGERREQDLRALDQIRVVVLARAVAGENQRRARLREVTREATDRVRRDPGDARRRFGREIRRAARAATRTRFAPAPYRPLRAAPRR